MPDAHETDARGSLRARAPKAEDAQRIVDRFRAGGVLLAAHDGQGVHDHDATSAHVHVARVLRAIKPIASVEDIKSQRFRVAVDSVNSSGSAGARLLLDALGCDLTHVHADSSGVFPHSPEPTPENLAGFSSVVRDAARVGFRRTPTRTASRCSTRRAAVGEGTLALWRALLKFDSAGPVRPDRDSRMVDDVARARRGRGPPDARGRGERENRDAAAACRARAAAG